MQLSTKMCSRTQLADVGGHVRTVCGEVRPGDGHSTSGCRLPSQPGHRARTFHADTCASATETFYHTHCSVNILAGTAPVLRSQVPRRCASARECYRTALAVATSLWTVPLVRQHLGS